MTPREPNLDEQLTSFSGLTLADPVATDIKPLAVEAQPWKSNALGVGNSQHIYRFPNAYGASVVNGPHTYGGPEGLWELAVLRFDGDASSLTYDTPITSDVIGWLTPDDVAALLLRIAALDGA